MIRRFVHLIVDDFKDGYTLRHIDIQPLFSPTAAAAASRSTRPTLLPRATRPPRPAAILESAGKRHDYKLHTDFFLLGAKVVGVNTRRRTVLYDTSTSAWSAGPDLRHGKFFQPTWAALQGKLYLTNMFPDDADFGTPCLEALRLDDAGELHDWCWVPLPSPPFFHEPYGSGSMIRCYVAGPADDNDNDKNNSSSSSMWISTLGKGTHVFDTATAKWRKAGDWALPFDGRVQYIPELGQWFGFSRKQRKLCSAGRLAVDNGANAGPLENVWEDVDGYTGTRWHLARSDLSYLGGGRFCVSRFYDTRRHWEDWCVPACDAVVMTAVEARPDASGGGLQMIKGASRCYRFSGAYTGYGWAL